MIVDRALYRGGVRQPDDGSVDLDVEVAGLADDEMLWVGLREPSPEEMEQVGRLCGLHHLLLEDVHKAHQRAKWDVFDEASLFVLKTASYLAPDHVVIGEVQVVVGPRFVLTVRHGDGVDLAKVRRRLEAVPALLAHGPMAVLYGVADEVVDEYAPVLAELETDIDEAEEAVFSDTRTNEAPRVYGLKRQVLELRRNVAPAADLFADLLSPEAVVMPEPLREYFVDVADHTHRTVSRIELARELLTDALNANLAQQGVQQNEDMRRISAWAAVIAAPTLLAGVWGMNFTHMPELEWWVGYPVALGMMAAISGVLVAYFRRVGWL